MTRDEVLVITGITKHQYYKSIKKDCKRPGRKCSTTTIKLGDVIGIQQVCNEEVVDDMVKIKSNPDTDYGYRAMTAALMLLGYVINQYPSDQPHLSLRERSL